jgi:phosphoglycolate phosphatase
MNRQFELIVFDWDGTLMDSEARIVDCMKQAICDLDLPTRTDDELKNIIGLGLKEALITLYPDGDEQIYNSLVAHYREHFLYTNQTPSELFAGVKEMLLELSERGHYLAVATGKGRQGLDKAMQGTGLEQFFHVTRCADETRSKPHPQMMEEIMTYVGTEPANTLMVGDTEYDLHMAHNARANSLAVSYGVHEKDRLLACNPLHCVDNIQQLHQWLTNEPGNLTRNGTDQ